MKNFYFLCGMPRAGNTILSSIINQNKKICITSHSVLPDIIYYLNYIKTTNVFKNFPDEKSLDNVIKNSFNNYYKNFKAEKIIDRGPWGTLANYTFLKKIIKNPKFIILYRPVLECLSSFVKIEKPKDIVKRCDEIMSNDGIIGGNLISIKNILNLKKNYLIIKYSDFVKTPLNEIKKIYDFLNLNYFDHKLNNFTDFHINNIKYDDTVLNAPLHKIRTDKIEQIQFNIEKILPEHIIKKYSGLDIL
jgi:hypothetical protein